MKLSLDLKTSLTQTLTPQQIQYLKLLQLPVMQLEQQMRNEVEQNPMLEELAPDDELEIVENYDDRLPEDDEEKVERTGIDEDADPFEFYKMLWQDDSKVPQGGLTSNLPAYDEDDGDTFQIKDHITLIEELINQLREYDLNEEELFLGEQIIGNTDEDGYLRRDLEEIVNETNSKFAEINFQAQVEYEKEKEVNNKNGSSNPARQFAISEEANELLDKNGTNREIFYDDKPLKIEINKNSTLKLLKPVDIEQAENILDIIIHLDPPGFSSRTIQECLLSQCDTIQKKNAAQKLACEILTNAYEPFKMKHYAAIQKQLGVGEDYLKEAIEFIRTLNPKPGGGDFRAETNSVIPDFRIYRDEESGEPIITVNDSRLPDLKLNQAYDKLKKEAKMKLFNKETREWIRNKYEDAKFLIQAIRQRKNTMLKVMTAIAGLQRNFFDDGEAGLKPLIYKDVAETTGLDISTVCRIVNGKYVQTDFGTYELKFFFSEALPNEDGEEISTRIIKNYLKEIIDKEDKKKPHSDDKLSKLLKEKGYQVARRTVAKYREQLKIPVARLRKEL